MRLTDTQRAEYISTMLAELRKLAETGGLADLAYLISVAESEALAVGRQRRTTD